MTIGDLKKILSNMDDNKKVLFKDGFEYDYFTILNDGENVIFYFSDEPCDMEKFPVEEELFTWKDIFSNENCNKDFHLDL